MLIITVSIALVLGAAIAAYIILAKDKVATDKNQNNQTVFVPFADQYREGCTSADLKLTSSPVPVAQLSYIEPLGKVLDKYVTPTDHQYFVPKARGNNSADVMMPADGTVVAISAMPSSNVGNTEQQAEAEDYRLVISHTCVYYSIFMHVRQLAEPLANAAGKLETNKSKRVKVPLKAGERLGKLGSNPLGWTFVNTSQTLAGFTTPSLYNSESWKIHVTDPLRLYNNDLKTTLENLSLRSLGPVGGKIDYDQKDALIGNWFREDTNGYDYNSKEQYWNGHLSVAPDYIDGVTTIVSIGNWIDNKAAQFAVEGEFDPTQILQGQGAVKVELMSLEHQLSSGQSWTGNETPSKDISVRQDNPVQGTIMFEVLKGNKLKVEKFPGKTAAQVSGFTSEAETYYR